MTTTFWIILFTSIAVFYAAPRLARWFVGVRDEVRMVQAHAKMKAEQPEMHEFAVKCYDGPCHGHIHSIVMPERPNWYISPYVPTDEDGVPDMENAIGQIKNTVYFEPNLAYYQQVDDEDYFYVRDITKAELDALVQHGVTPSPQKDESEQE